jgi:hypothetical protein
VKSLAYRSTVSAPFADFTWRHARSLLAARGADDTNETAIAAVAAQLLDRVETGPDRRVVARAQDLTATIDVAGLIPAHRQPQRRWPGHHRHTTGINTLVASRHDRVHCSRHDREPRPAMAGYAP